MTINIFWGATLFFIFGIALPPIIIVLLKKHRKILNLLVIISAVLYFSFLFVGTTFKIQYSYPNVSFVPSFDKPWLSMNFIAFGFGKINIISNLILFLPLGFIVYTFAKKHRFLKTILLAFVLSISIEILQWILPVSRNTEILDVLLNTLSGTISATYCYVLDKFNIFSNEKRER